MDMWNASLWMLKLPLFVHEWWSKMQEQRMEEREAALQEWEQSGGNGAPPHISEEFELGKLRIRKRGGVEDMSLILPDNPTSGAFQSTLRVNLDTDGPQYVRIRGRIRSLWREPLVFSADWIRFWIKVNSISFG